MSFDHLSDLGLSEKQLKDFSFYRDVLLHWNNLVNLTAITEPMEVEIKHFFDSLLLRRCSFWTGRGKVADVGTGAGFPGMPLKIVSPELVLDMFEASGKRVKFLQELSSQLAIENVRAFHLRAEEAGQHPDFRENYDWALSRAVAAMPVLLEYCLPFLRVGGFMAAYKGPAGRKEAEDSKKAADLLGGKLVEVYEIALPMEQGERSILIYQKVEHTPKSYPRRPGIPAKQPLK